MFTSDRRNRIKNLIYETKRVDVSELSERFSVSEVTIRKDLEYLEKANVLIRTHGGAVLNEVVSIPEKSIYTSNNIQNTNIKNIGSLFPYLISDNEFIFLGTGSICTEIARNLKSKKNLTVLTNNISAAIHLSENQNIKVMTTPGQVVREKDEIFLTNSDVATFLSNRYVDKCILEVDAINSAIGFCINDSFLCDIYKQIIKNSNQVLIGVESNNFNKNAFSILGNFSIAHQVVSDVNVPDEFMKLFLEHNIKVFTSYDIGNL